MVVDIFRQRLTPTQFHHLCLPRLQGPKEKYREETRKNAELAQQNRLNMPALLR